MANVVCAAVLTLAAGCHRSGDSTGSTEMTSAAQAPASSVAPVDHLGPGELLEGGEQAFGITLPRGVHVDEPFDKVVFASGMVPVEALVSYLRAHLKGGDVRVGESSATFDHVTAPSDPNRPLSIHIALVHQKTTVELRDLTVTPGPKLPDDTARWRAVGLTPSGRLLDPTHLD